MSSQRLSTRLHAAQDFVLCWESMAVFGNEMNSALIQAMAAIKEELDAAVDKTAVAIYNFQREVCKRGRCCVSTFQSIHIHIAL